MSPKNIASNRPRWSQAHASVAAKPLACCPAFPQIAERWEAWWRFDADRPLVVVSLPTRSDIRWDKGFDLFDRPSAWLQLRRTQVESRYRVDATLPALRIDLGPVAPGAFLGAPLQIANRDQTTWQTPVMHSLTDPTPSLDPANPWWQLALHLTQLTARDAAGRYLVSLPDLSGSIDILANLRGIEPLLMDLADCPESVRRHSSRLVDAWEQIFCALHNLINDAGAGASQWGVWSEPPFTVATCDFNAMLGPDQFQALCMPEIEDQAKRLGRLVFHLDGPDAARHADVLAQSPHITAVQFTPGAATPSALAHFDRLQRIQAAGKPLLLNCPAAEVPELVKRLDPHGLALTPEGLQSPEEADELMQRVTTCTR